MTKDWQGKTYWIVGASEGLGRAVAARLSNAGAKLVLSARNEARLSELAQSLPHNCVVAPCDVRDAQSVQIAAATAGSIDGVIYLSAVYEPLSANQWNTDTVTTMIDVNLSGAARVIGAALPIMAKAPNPHIVLVASLAGKKGLPNAVGYGASKAGLIHLAENLRADLGDDRYKVQLINPGFIKSRLTDKNNFRMPFIMTQAQAAKRCVRAMQSGRFRTSFPWRLGAIIGALSLLPDWLYFKLITPKGGDENAR